MLSRGRNIYLQDRLYLTLQEGKATICEFGDASSNRKSNTCAMYDLCSVHVLGHFTLSEFQSSCSSPRGLGYGNIGLHRLPR